ncbi:hypothetical protein EVJ58_g1122 [Rhodofomes roseus]|uniref:PPM-type phosphatase domain-containing protein n=1 Tax=Rhodofomes roseus TaxID=34475 RepID=A0A4Y9Z317_9APHY|nr:hypothetical protein EVJ58_g1122 [Rhodofomes roseus]
MEDAHAIVVPFAGVRGQAFFAIFDGHAGKQAAEWCGANFSTCFLEAIKRDPTATIPDAFNQTFHDVDGHLSQLSEESDGKMHAGCTAVTAFLRLEDADGKQSFLPPHFDPIDIALADMHLDDEASDGEAEGGHEKVSNRARIKQFFKPANHDQSSPPPSQASSANTNEKDNAWTLPRNATQEAKRIMDAGGFVMSGRVNGVLAVTRSLGDSSMKEFVVGAPYTTETELSEEDEFLILACDGLWDVIDDQKACELVRSIADPRRAAEELLDYAYKNYSTDNVTVLVVRLRSPPEAMGTEQNGS